MAAVPDGSVSAVFSSHNVEHLHAHEFPQAFGEFFRVLRDDGYALITCPDLEKVCEKIVTGGLLEPVYISRAGPIAPIDILFGHRASIANGNRYMAHHSGFTSKVLSQSLVSCGFQTVVTLARPGRFDLWSSRDANADGQAGRKGHAPPAHCRACALIPTRRVPHQSHLTCLPAFQGALWGA